MTEYGTFRLDVGEGFICLVDTLQSLFIHNQVDVSPYEIHSCVKYCINEGLAYTDFSGTEDYIRSAATNITADVVTGVEYLWMSHISEVSDMSPSKDVVQRAAWSLGDGMNKLATIVRHRRDLSLPRHVFFNDSYNELLVYFNEDL